MLLFQLYLPLAGLRRAWPPKQSHSPSAPRVEPVSPTPPARLRTTFRSNRSTVHTRSPRILPALASFNQVMHLQRSRSLVRRLLLPIQAIPSSPITPQRIYQAFFSRTVQCPSPGALWTSPWERAGLRRLAAA